jgi:subtilisin family serine protease
LFRGTLAPFVSTVTAAVAVLAVIWTTPGTFGLSSFSARGATMDSVRAQEWWLPELDAGQAWQQTQGTGITVAVLGTGVAADHPDLTGQVVTGPDYTGSGRQPAGEFWGVEGTAVAAIIAGHGHGAGGGSGIAGIAPRAKILSVQVTLEYNDPLVADPAISRRLPDAIAAGIRYAVSHGARVIDLPLDPGTLGLTGHGDPAAAGGSPAEQAAVGYALSKGVVLVAPAGDDGLGTSIVNYPAAYPGVIAVGALARDGRLASFGNRHSYVSLTAPGAALPAAIPPGGYEPISSTSMASGLVAGVAALLLAKFPDLTVAQVTRALAGSAAPGTAGTALPVRSAGGNGYGLVNAARALTVAGLLVAPPKAAAPPARPKRTPPARTHTPAPPTLPGKAAASTLADSLVRYVVAGLIALIVLLTGLLAAVRIRRARRAHRVRASAASDAGRPHQHHTSPPATGPQVVEIRPPAGGWQGSGLGEMVSREAQRPAIARAPRSAAQLRGGHGPGGPPWERAQQPEQTPNPLPMMSHNTVRALGSGPGIRVPGDMAALPAAEPDASPAFDLTADYPTRPDLMAETGTDAPTQQSLGFAAAPTPADYQPSPPPDEGDGDGG